MYQQMTIAVVIPALNEEQSIALVVRELKALSNDKGQPLIDDIVVCDNGSTDATDQQAARAGARVVYESAKGYGAACLKAMQALSEPDVVVFVDADRSVCVNEIDRLLESIDQGADLVIGSRDLGFQEPGALTPQQSIGNKLATRLISWLWKQPVSDLGPFRAIRFKALQMLAMNDKAFGWTVEMQVKAIQRGLVVTEVPVMSLKRIGHSKISGTVTGVIGAALGIFGMIAQLWWQEKFTQHKTTVAGWMANIFPSTK